jgi:hypothetical protein
VARTPGAAPVKVGTIVLYDNGVRVYGSEPGSGTPPPAGTTTTPGTATTVGTATPPGTATAVATGTASPGPASATITATATAGGSVGCQVTYAVTNQWDTGFQAEVAIRNNAAALNGWTLTWSFPSGQTLTQAWNARATQSGATVQAANETWNGSLPGGGTTSLGFLASYSGTNTAPTTFALNGVPCNQPGGPPTTEPTAPPTATPLPSTAAPTATSTPLPPTSTAVVASPTATVPSATATALPGTATGTRAATATATATSTSTATATPTATGTATATTVPPTATTVPPTPTTAATPAAAALRLQYRTGDTNATDNQIRPQFQIVNAGTTGVALSDLRIRYWYTVDGERPQNYWCDWATRGCANVTASFGRLPSPRPGADSYLEVGFTAAAGSLAPGASSGEVQMRFARDDWSAYDERNDHSFDVTKATYQDWARVTLYRNGVLVWGVEP